MSLAKTIVYNIDTTIKSILTTLLKANVVNLTYNINNQETSHVHLLDIKGNGPHPSIILVHGLGSCGNQFYKLILEYYTPLIFYSFQEESSVLEAPHILACNKK